MTSLRSRAAASTIIWNRVVECSAAHFLEGPSKQFASFVPIALRPYETDGLGGVGNAPSGRKRLGERHLNKITANAVNAGRFIDKNGRCRRIAAVFEKFNHFNFSPRPAAHFAQRDTASPHLCTFFGLNCHSPVTPLQLSRLFFLTSQPATTTDNPPFWFHSADRTSAGRRRPRPSARSGPVAAVTPNRLPVPGLSGDRLTAGGVSKQSPPAF